MGHRFCCGHVQQIRVRGSTWMRTWQFWVEMAVADTRVVLSLALAGRCPTRGSVRSGAKGRFHNPSLDLSASLYNNHKFPRDAFECFVCGGYSGPPKPTYQSHFALHFAVFWAMWWYSWHSCPNHVLIVRILDSACIWCPTDP